MKNSTSFTVKLNNYRKKIKISQKNYLNKRKKYFKWRENATN